jgi:hypothetical protein
MSSAQHKHARERRSARAASGAQREQRAVLSARELVLSASRQRSVQANARALSAALRELNPAAGPGAPARASAERCLERAQSSARVCPKPAHARLGASAERSRRAALGVEQR